VVLRQKTRGTALGNVSEPSLLSVLRNRWRVEWQPFRTLPAPGPRPQDPSPSQCSAELHPLIDSLRLVRYRILLNHFLAAWVLWCSCIFATLIAVLAISAKSSGVTLSAAVLIGAGTAILAVWLWRGRPTLYDTARRLDSAAKLHDRLTTALHFAAAPQPEGLLGMQRRDACRRVATLSPRSLFPIAMPANAGRAAVLLLAVSALFLYRLHYKPPLTALLQSVTRSQLVQSVLTPMVNAVEKDLQRTLALVNSQQDPAANDVRNEESKPLSDDLWQPDDEKDANSEEAQNSQEATIADQQPQQPNPDGKSQTKDGESQQESEGQQPSQSDGKKNSQSKEDSQQNSADSNASQSKSLMQALKNMLSNSANQKANSQASQPPEGQGASQDGNSHQPGSSEGDRKGDSRGSSDAQQKASKSSSSGAGSQQGTKDLRKDQASEPVNGVPDRVALESNGFKEQVRVRVDSGTGTAQLPVRDGSSTATAVVNGAEQENIPARYRLYVQHYFEHSDNNAQK
jgi:hypothetical protein